MTLTTSFSSIGTFTLCPRQWYLREYRGLGPINEVRTGALGFGGRVHSALEQWGTGAVDSPVTAWNALMSTEYALAAEREFIPPELSKEDELGLVMLEGFEDWWVTEGEDQEFEVIDVESKLSNELEVLTADGEVVRIWLYGKLDQLLRHRDTGQLWIRDWKTTRNLEEPTKEGLEWSSQPRIYKALVEQDYPDTHIAGVRYTCLRKVKRTAAAKPPFFFNYDLQLPSYNVAHHMGRVRAIAGKMVDTAAELDRGVPHVEAAPFSPGWQCKTCPFKNVCYLWQSASIEAGEDMLEDQFQLVDPFSRYRDEAEGTVEL